MGRVAGTMGEPTVTCCLSSMQRVEAKSRGLCVYGKNAESELSDSRSGVDLASADMPCSSAWTASADLTRSKPCDGSSLSDVMETMCGAKHNQNQAQRCQISTVKTLQDDRRAVLDMHRGQPHNCQGRNRLKSSLGTKRYSVSQP